MCFSGLLPDETWVWRDWMLQRLLQFAVTRVLSAVCSRLLPLVLRRLFRVLVPDLLADAYARHCAKLLRKRVIASARDAIVDYLWKVVR